MKSVSNPTRPTVVQLIAWRVIFKLLLALVAALASPWPPALAASDQTPPTVSIVSPSGGTVSHVVVLSATASDNIGIASVEFLVDGNSIGTATSAPYLANWNSTAVPNGSYTITAVASDTAGNQTTSDPVIVTVQNPGFVNEVVVPGIVSATTIVFLPDGRMLVGELTETIWVVQPGANVKDPTPFLQLDGSELMGEQGLMDITLDPDFSQNGYYYVFYTRGFPLHDNYNRVSRFTASGDGTIPGSEVVIWQDSIGARDEHHGGALAFGADGKLYVTVGDQFNPEEAQQMDSYHGKILRINSDGTIPVDNPFFDGDGPNLDEIWALGLRNPFRMSIDRVTGAMYIGNVGGNDNETAVEEVNLGVAGANYGWPFCEGQCSLPGMTDPIFSYPHAGRDGCVIGGFVYRGSQFPAEYYGSYFFADYVQNWIKRLTFDSQGNVQNQIDFDPADGTPDGPTGDPVKLVEGPDGSIYYVDIGFNDSHVPNEAAIRRIRYVLGDQPPVVAASASPTSGSPPLNVTFSSVGSFDPEGAPLSYQWTFGDGSSSTLPNPTHTYSNAGPFVARLLVSDGSNSSLSSDLNIVVGNPPVASILSPRDGSIFRAGDIIEFSGRGTDPEDGELPPGAFTWTIIFHHEGHIHPGAGPLTNITSGTFPIPVSGHDFNGATSYEIILRVTDSTGLKAATSVTVFPDKVNLYFDTVPTGLSIDVNGIRKVAPFIYDALIGFQETVNAPSQVFGGIPYDFASWSDGQPQTHTIIVPETDQTFKVFYVSPLAPSIESEVWLAGLFRLRFQSIVGRSYRVEWTPNLPAGNWTTITNGLRATSDIMEITDSDTPGKQQKFYRVVLLPETTPTGPPNFARAAESHDAGVQTLDLRFNSSGQNRVLIVGLCWTTPGASSISSLTYNGVACNEIATAPWLDDNGQTALYYLPAPAIGTNTLHVTMSAFTAELSMSAILVTNANQTNVVGSAVSNYDSAAITTVSVPSGTNDLVVDVLGFYDDTLIYTPGPGQTLRITSDNLGDASNKMSTKAGTSAATTMRWNISSAHNISQIGVAIHGP